MNNDNNDNKLAAPTDAEKVILTVENSAHRIIAKASENKLVIAAAVAAVVLASLLYAMVTRAQNRAENAAWRQIFAADFSARQQPKTVDLHGKFAQGEKDTAGAKARFYIYMRELAQYGASADKADWEKAAAAAEKFTREFPSHPFINQVRMDYAAVLTNLGAYDKAEAQYNAVAAAGTPDEKASARMFTAMLQERSGKEEAAHDSYARLANDLANREVATIAAFARLRLEEKMKAAAAPQKTEPAASATPEKAAPAATPTAQPAPAPAPQAAAPAVK